MFQNKAMHSRKETKITKLIIIIITLVLAKIWAISGLSSSKTLSLWGVAITMWGLVTNLFTWLPLSKPPTTTVRVRWSEYPRIQNWWASWTASSRVGVSTRANTPKGASPEALENRKRKGCRFTTTSLINSNYMTAF